jgi:hypothetical protein
MVAAIGAATIGYSYHRYDSRYSGSGIIERNKPIIESIYREERYSEDRRIRGNAESKKESRLSELRDGLAKLKKRSSSERCQFEMSFNDHIYGGPKIAAIRAVPGQKIQKHKECTAKERVKDASALGPFTVGFLILVYGIYGFIVSSFPGSPSYPFPLRAEIAKLRKDMIEERRKSLIGYGVPNQSAKYIAKESVMCLDYSTIKYERFDHPSLLRAMADIGFSTEEISGLFQSNPYLLNHGGSNTSVIFSMLSEFGFSKTDILGFVRDQPGVVNQGWPDTPQVLQVYAEYGFTKKDISAMIRLNPNKINHDPKYLAYCLKRMEKCGMYTPDEVRQKMLVSKYF